MTSSVEVCISCWVSLLLGCSVCLAQMCDVEGSDIETGCTQGDIRLRGSSNTHTFGRVEICNQNTWGTVCEDSWDVQDAAVACRQLGLSPIGAEIRTSGFTVGNNCIWLDDVRCAGNEERLIDCPANPVGVHDCLHWQDVGVLCETNCDHGDIRLTPANSNTFSLVEICNQNLWGTVCGIEWDNSDAAVACRQLGHSPIGAQSRNQYSLGDTWLYNVRCTGSEDRLIDCPANPIGSCEDWRNVAVLCVPSDITSPLVTSASSSRPFTDDDNIATSTSTPMPFTTSSTTTSPNTSNKGSDKETTAPPNPARNNTSPISASTPSASNNGDNNAGDTDTTPPLKSTSNNTSTTLASVFSVILFIVIIMTVVVILAVYFVTRRVKRSHKGVAPPETPFSAYDYPKSASFGTTGRDYETPVCPAARVENSFDNAMYAGEGPNVYADITSIKLESNTTPVYDTVSAPAVLDDIYVIPASNEDALYSQLAEIIISQMSRDSLKIKEEIGHGQFGTVHKGVLERGEVEVAVKTLKEGSGEEDRIKFLQEAAIMAQFKHPNVVEMHGVITIGEPVLIVLELLTQGDLRKHLREKSCVDPHTLLSYCRQVASGMAYLSSKAFVHRDLAARNILLSDYGICKIADFGMSRDLMDESYYVSHGGMIPVKWTAPEALHYKKYSTASDVWSYGALMYEIWSLGHKPFEGYTNIKVIQMVEKGYRLPPPPGCPREVYKIMIRCWHCITSKRPNFTNITEQLSLPDTKLLKWSEEDKSVHPEAAQLGADLLCGEELYKDQQSVYRSTI